MNDDERTIAALRVALDERAADIEAGDRLDEILERANPQRGSRMNRSWVLLAAAAAVLAVVAGVRLGLPDGSQPVPGGIDRPIPSATPSMCARRRIEDGDNRSRGDAEAGAAPRAARPPPARRRASTRRAARPR